MAMKVVAVHGVSVALACRRFQISETCYRYSPTLSDENEEIADWLEPQTRLPDLPRTGAETADQTQETAEAQQARTAGCA